MILLWLFLLRGLDLIILYNFKLLVMDFPQFLETCAFVDEKAQIEQSISLLLKNVVGSFIQDHSIGALFDVHVFDYVMIHAGTYQTLSILPIEIHSIDVEAPDESDSSSECKISVVHSYNNELSVFKNYN